MRTETKQIVKILILVYLLLGLVLVVALELWRKY